MAQIQVNLWFLYNFLKNFTALIILSILSLSEHMSKTKGRKITIKTNNPLNRIGIYIKATASFIVNNIEILWSIPMMIKYLKNVE